MALVFFSVSGGAYGIEGLFSACGPGMGLLLLLVTPLVYGVPHALVCAELGTALPVDGGYYHWVRRGLGDFWGFQQGVLSWLCSFVDMAVYPVLFTAYLQSTAAWAAPGRHVLFTAGHLRFDLHWVTCLAVIGSSAVYALFCLSSFGSLVIVDVFLTNITLLLQVAALVALRVREPELERPYRIPGGGFGLTLVTLSLTAVCAWAAWQQYTQNGTRAVAYCLVAVGGSALLCVPLARRRHRVAIPGAPAPE